NTFDRPVRSDLVLLLQQQVNVLSGVLGEADVLPPAVGSLGSAPLEGHSPVDLGVVVHFADNVHELSGPVLYLGFVEVERLPVKEPVVPLVLNALQLGQ